MPPSPQPEASVGRSEARDLAERARPDPTGRQRHGGSFAARLFLGQIAADALLPLPRPDVAELARAQPVLDAIMAALAEHLDPEDVARTGQIPPTAMAALHAAGAFRLKIPVAYGGLGLHQCAYNRIMEHVSTWCGSTAIMLSGHQSIGVPTPLSLFGTEAQKARYLPRMASGGVSAFALTEAEAGSDPARMRTEAMPTEDGKAWRLSGEKLWCTNGPLADTIVVMARTPSRVEAGKARTQISAFLVEMDWPGCEVVHRCSFMGYAGIQSGVLRFRDVLVPAENLLGEPGQGLKLALVTLNTGRLTLPATNAAAARQLVAWTRRWASERRQWGEPIGAHEAVAAQVSWMAAHAFAMQAVSDHAAVLADRGETDIRLEAALAKLFASECLCQVADRAVQIRGGRGYETHDSLVARGEHGWPIERAYREARLNRIVEGTSEIMRLFLAREALDPHLKRAGALLDPRASRWAKIVAFLRLGAFYAPWYAARLLPIGRAAPGLPPTLRGPWRRLRRESRRLARRIFHGMVRHGPQLEHRQALLGRAIDDGTDLYAVAVALARAARDGTASSNGLATTFAQHAFQRIASRGTHPARLDAADRRLAQEVLAGEHAMLEEGISLRMR